MRTQPVYSNAGFVQPLEIRKGSDFVIVLLLLNGSPEVPVDVTGLEVKARMTRVGADTFVDFVPTIQVRADGNAYVELKIDRAVTSGLDLSPISMMAPPIYNWTCDIKMSTGNVTPICYGPCKVIKGETVWP
jgi:hypothetical protein